MARLVKKTETAPKQVGDKYICMCGLSKDQPFCDHSHERTMHEEEEKLYWYDGEHVEEIETTIDDCCGGQDGECCGHCANHK